MGPLLIYLSLMAVGAVLAARIASWASRGSRSVRNATGLLFAALASYATGFLLDMWVATVAGDIPPGNIVAPSFTWFAISAAGILAALTTQAAPGWLGIPFGVNAAIALVAVAVRPRHLVVAVSVFLVGIAVVIVRRRRQVVSLVAAGMLLNTPRLLGQDRSSIEAQISRWQQDVARNPKDYERLAAIGAAYGKLGEHATAVIYFNKAITVNPSYAEAYLGLGSAYGFLRRPGEAAVALRRAVSLDPKNPYARAKLGSTLGRAGHYQEAVTELKEAIRFKPDLADAHFALGSAYLSLNDRPQAVAEVDVLSRLDPQLATQLRGLVDQHR